MTQGSVKDTTGYVNYVYNISARGTTQVASQLMGLSGITSNILGQLAFQTSSYLSTAEGALLSMGVVASAGFAKATQQATEFDQALATIGAISGKTTSEVSGLGDEAMAMSSKFGMAVGEMTQGLETLARAGVSTGNMKGILEQAMGLSKLEGLSLETAINSLISTTNLLDIEGLDLQSPEYVEAVKRQNQRITATSEAAPINAQDIIHTLEHVGGYASSTKLDQEDLFAVIAQLGSKGTKSEIAGTSLRAFLAAGQKDTAQRALKRVGLNVKDLWKNDEQILSISDMKDVLDEAMESKGYTQQEKLEFYSDFAGYKQANQIMKIDTTSVREFKEKIDDSWDMSKKIQQVIGTAETNLQGLLQAATNLLTNIGRPILPFVSVIAGTAKTIIEVINKIPGSDLILGGALLLASVKAISTIFNKIAPQLLAAKGNIFSIKDLFANLKKDLNESYKIIKNINNVSWIRNQSAWNSAQNVTNEDKVLYWKEKMDGKYDVRDINDVYYLENNKDYKKKYTEWKYNRSVQGQQESNQRNARQESQTTTTSTEEKKIDLTALEAATEVIARAILEIKKILPKKRINFSDLKIGSKVTLDDGIFKQIKDHTFKVVVMNKSSEGVPVYKISKKDKKKSMQERFFKNINQQDPKNKNDNTNQRNSRLNNNTETIPSTNRRNTKDIVEDIQMGSSKNLKLFTKRKKTLDGLSTFELGSNDISNFIKTLDIDFGFDTKTPEGKRAQEIMSEIFNKYTEANLRGNHVNFTGLGEKELIAKMENELEGYLEHSGDNRMNKGYLQYFGDKKITKEFFRDAMEERVKIFTSKDIEKKLSYTPKFLKNEDDVDINARNQHYKEKKKKHNTLLDELKSGNNPFNVRTKKVRDWKVKDRKAYKSQIEGLYIGDTDFEMGSAEAEILNKVLRRVYGDEVQLKSISKLKGVNKQLAIRDNVNKVLKANNGKFSKKFYKQLEEALDNEVNGVSKNHDLLNEIGLEYENINEDQLRLFAHIANIDLTKNQKTKEDVAKKIIRTARITDGLKSRVKKPYGDGKEMYIEEVMKALYTDKLANFFINDLDSASQLTFMKEKGLDNTLSMKDNLSKEIEELSKKDDKESIRQLGKAKKLKKMLPYYAMVEYFEKVGFSPGTYGAETVNSKVEDLNRVKELGNIIEVEDTKLKISSVGANGAPVYDASIKDGMGVSSEPSRALERVLKLLGHDETGSGSFYLHAKKVGDAAFELAVNEALPIIEQALYEEIMQMPEEEQAQYLTKDGKHVKKSVIYKQIRNLHIPYRRKHHPFQLTSDLNDQDLKETIKSGAQTRHDTLRGNELTQTYTEGSPNYYNSKALFVSDPDDDAFIFTNRKPYLQNDEDYLRNLKLKQIKNKLALQENYGPLGQHRTAKLTGINARVVVPKVGVNPNARFGAHPFIDKVTNVDMFERNEATHGRNFLNTSVYKIGNKLVATQNPPENAQFMGFLQNMSGDIREGHNDALSRRRNKIYTQNRQKEVFGSMALKYGLSRSDIMNSELSDYQKERIEELYYNQDFVNLDEYFTTHSVDDFVQLRGAMLKSNKYKETSKGIQYAGNVFHSWVSENEYERLKEEHLIDVTEGDQGILDVSENEEGETQYKITNYDALHYSRDDLKAKVLLEDLARTKEIEETYKSLNIDKHVEKKPEEFVKNLMKKEDDDIHDIMLALSIYNPEFAKVVQETAKEKMEKMKNYIAKQRRALQPNKNKIKNSSQSLSDIVEQMYGMSVAEHVSPEILDQMGIEKFDELDAYVNTLAQSGRVDVDPNFNNLNRDQREEMFLDFFNEETYADDADRYNEDYLYGADSSPYENSQTIGDFVYENQHEEILKNSTFIPSSDLDYLPIEHLQNLRLEGLSNMVPEDELKTYTTLTNELNDLAKEKIKKDTEYTNAQLELLNIALNIQNTEKKRAKAKEEKLSEEEETLKEEKSSKKEKETRKTSFNYMNDLMNIDVDAYNNVETHEVRKRAYTKTSNFAADMGQRINSFVNSAADFIYNKTGGRNNDDLISATNKAAESMHNVNENLKGFNQFLSEASNAFPPLITAVIALETVIGLLTKAEEISIGIQSFLNIGNVLKTSENGVFEFFGKSIEGDSAEGKILLSLSSILGETISKLITLITRFARPLMLLGGVIATITTALDWSYKSHEKYLKQLQDEEKANKSRSKGLQTTNAQNKKALMRNRNEEREDELGRRYRLSKQKLDAANLTRTSGALDLTGAENDTLWGKYGIASALNKIQGKYESTAAEYDGTSGQIRRIKEHTTGGQGLIRGMPGYYSQAEEMVAAYYDANQLAIGVMDEYKDELGELYDAETNSMRRHRGENPRETKEFQRALDKFVEATGITKEHAQQYLDYMQTEHSVDNATQAMKAQADLISANTEMKIQAISFGGNPSDVLGLNGIEAQQNAMVQAQADMIQLELSSQLWWKAVWSTLTSPIRAVIAPIFSIVHILSAIWSFVTGNWDSAGMHMKQAGASLDVLGETATYWGAWATAESTDFNSIGQGAIDENDRANYGNAKTASGSGGPRVKNPESNAFFGMFPVGWPNTFRGHGIEDHKNQLGQNAQESILTKVTSPIVAILGAISASILTIIAILGIKVLNDKFDLISKLPDFLSGPLNHIKEIGSSLYADYVPDPIKNVIGAGEGFIKDIGSKIYHGIEERIPDSWKEKFNTAKDWIKNKTGFGDEEKISENDVAKATTESRDILQNIFDWLTGQHDESRRTPEELASLRYHQGGTSLSDYYQELDELEVNPMQNLLNSVNSITWVDDINEPKGGMDGLGNMKLNALDAENNPSGILSTFIHELSHRELNHRQREINGEITETDDNYKWRASELEARMVTANFLQSMNLSNGDMTTGTLNEDILKAQKEGTWAEVNQDLVNELSSKMISNPEILLGGLINTIQGSDNNKLDGLDTAVKEMGKQSGVENLKIDETSFLQKKVYDADSDSSGKMNEQRRTNEEYEWYKNAGAINYDDLSRTNKMRTKGPWGTYAADKIDTLKSDYVDPWKSYLSTQKNNFLLGFTDEEDRTAFNKKKRSGMNKDDREYLNEKYNLGLDLGSFRTSKQANKAVRNKLDETGQWDAAMNEMYVDQQGGYGQIIQKHLTNNYVDPWKEYGKKRVKNVINDAEAYRKDPDSFKDASSTTKMVAKGLDIKEKIFGANTSGTSIMETLKDPEKMEELIKNRLDQFDSDSTIGKYRDKAYKAQELMQDPEKAMNWLQGKYYGGLDQGQEEYQYYQGGQLDYGELSGANKIRHMKEQVLGMSGEESFADLLQDPERTIEVAKRGYTAFKEGGFNGLLGADEDYDVGDSVKNKVAELFGKIKKGAEEGIDEENGEEGGSGGLIQKAKEKLAGMFDGDTSPITKEEMEEKQKSGDYEKVSDWKSRKLSEIEEEKKEPFSDKIKDKISDTLGLKKTPLNGRTTKTDIEGQQALTNSGLLGNQKRMGIGQAFYEESPGAAGATESILPLGEDEDMLPDVSGRNIRKGGKMLSKIGGKLSGKGGKLGKIGNVLSKAGGGMSKLGKGGIGKGLSKLGGKGLGKLGGKLGGKGLGKIGGKLAGKGLGKIGGKIGGKIMGKVGGKIAGKVGAQVASKVLAGGLAATGIGAPLAAIMASPIGGFLMEGAMNLGGKALGAIGGAVGGIGKALFGRKPIGDRGGGGGLLKGLAMASPLGMVAGAAGGLLGSVFGGKGLGNMGKMGGNVLQKMAVPLGGVAGILGKMFSNDKQTKNLNEKMEAHASKTLDAVKEQNTKSASSSNNSGGNITIQNININTDDDPEAIKAMFLELIVELQEQVNPRLVSRTAGKAPTSSTSSGPTEETSENTDSTSGNTDSTNSTTNNNQTNSTN